MNNTDINIDLTNLIPTNGNTKQYGSPANIPTYKTKNGIVRKKPIKTSTLTPANKKFSEVYAKTNNGSQAITEAFPELKNSSPQYKSLKAQRMLKNDVIINHVEYQKNKLERIASQAVDKIEDHIESDDSNVSLNASKFVIEQVHGKAVQKSSSVNFNFTSHVTDKGSEYKL